ncbi:hypothetical protein [Saccharopolyspora sp. ASAGF58]|uniref:hypothetical protein n=1 Tax=Saccharopolyspora sp. ASAGF58 TaxID=2719023 RepID=UPI00143FCCFE|nr:hypothetical protein [Saccharopolyspora sp. ASAGF58]QIZ36502.1 hypothetical protein FDZ84_19810 [Saccharopolyspora sp. ASAGF58]
MRALQQGLAGARAAVETFVPKLAIFLVAGVGGGLIRPMRQRWSRWLNSAEAPFAPTRRASKNGAKPETGDAGVGGHA